MGRGQIIYWVAPADELPATDLAKLSDLVGLSGLVPREIGRALLVYHGLNQ